MGAGKKAVDGVYLTCRGELRRVTVDDIDVDSIVEVLDTRIDEHNKPVTSGYNAFLALYVLLDGITGADVSLYVKADEECDTAEDSSSSSSSGCSEWCFVRQDSVTQNQMLVYSELPAGEYKVMIDSISGAGEVIIREQHSA